MAVSIPQVVTEDRASGALVIDGSLKFQSDKSTYLQRSQSGGNRRTFTVSAWIKKGQFNAGANDSHDWFSASEGNTTGGSDYGFGIRFPYHTGHSTHSDQLMIFEYENGAFKLRYISEQVFRDHDGFYHIVVAVDTTQSSTENRVRAYINGEEITDWKSGYKTDPTENLELTVNESGKNSQIGTSIEDGSLLLQQADGYASNFYLIDGQQLGPEEFGFTDPLTNTWRPKKYEGDFTFVAENELLYNVNTGDNGFDSGTSSRTYDATGRTFATYSTPQTANPGGFGANSAHVYKSPDGAAIDWVISTDTTDRYIWTSTDGVNWTNTGVQDTDGSVVTVNTAWLAIAGGSNSSYATVTTTSSGYGPAVNANSFYLPMDGNSPIGQDQSGRGNDWTPVNFGGSNSIEKATGALPILNTLGGTVARPGVFGSEVSANYTTTASTNTSNGFVFANEGTKPTLSFVRGGTYTFDYSASSSHPLYLSSLQNGKHNSKAYSVSFDGTGDYLSVPDHADLQFGTSAFTVECYVWFNSYNSVTYPSIISKYTGGTTSWIMRVKNDGKVIYYDGGGSNNESTSTPIGLNKWHHIAMVREGTGSNQAKMYVDGKLVITTTDATDYTDTQVITIGAQNTSANNALDGYMSNVRIIKGTALYTSDFTPPQTTLTNVTNTKLLCCQDSNAATAAVIPSGSITVGADAAASQSRQPFLYDSNHGNFGVNTATSNVTKITVPHLAADTLYYYCNSHTGMGNSISVTTDIKKADPYAWKCVFASPLVGNDDDISDEINVNSTAKATTTSGAAADSSDSNFYGGSYTFDGTNDYVKTDANTSDFNFGSGDFTLECWININAGTARSLLSLWDYQNSQRSWNVYINGSGHLTLITSTNGSSQSDRGNTGETLPSNKWIHIAMTKENNVYRTFVDGVLKVSETASETIYNNTNDPIYIGCTNGVTEFFNGHIQDVRIYKGVAKYTSNFIPAATNPDILPDTPSGVATKTQLTKITDGAVYFDGNGDYLQLDGDMTDFQFGTGDFTVESWIWKSENGANNYDGIADYGLSGNGADGWFFEASASRGYVFYSDGTNVIQYNSSPNLSKWIHVAVTRNSGTNRLFVDGKLVASNTTSFTVPTSGTKFDVGAYDTDGTGYYYFKGFISNFRVVKGTALYTSDFTPPTRTLTNVTNTKLLCCQSNTSATAAAVTPVSITASGNASATNFNPFTTDINTVRGQEGSYCTWNPLTKSRGNLLDGNLLFYGDGTNTPRINGSISQSSGKWYYEVTVLNDGPGTGSGDVHNSIGWGFDNISNIETAPNNSSMEHSFYFMDSGWYKNFSGSNTNSSTGKWLAGDVIGVAADLDNNILTFYKNGIEMLSQTIGTTAGTSLCPAHQSNTGTYGRSISNFGQKPFKFPPPDGFQPLTSSTVRPDTVDPRSDQYVKATTYTGNGASTPGGSGGTQTINVGFKPDLIWIKDRTQAHNNNLIDSVNGAPNLLMSDLSNGLTTDSTDGLTAITDNGFTLGDNGEGTQSLEMNKNGNNYVAWTWKAGGGKSSGGGFFKDDVEYGSAAAAGLTAGSITPDAASVGTKQGFSIIKYSLSGSSAQTIPHGLDGSLGLLITKATTTTNGWAVWHSSIGDTQGLVISGTNAASSVTWWDQSNMTNNVFAHIAGTTSQSGAPVIAYCWKDVPGLQKFGQYTGNSSSSGPFIECGFRPALILLKKIVSTDSNSGWHWYDNKRNTYNPANNFLLASGAYYENRAQNNTADVTTYTVDFLSNGFRLTHGSNNLNSSGATYIYAAWAEAPSFNLYGATSNAR